MALGNIILLTIFATVVALLCLRASSSVLARGERTKIVLMPDRMPNEFRKLAMKEIRDSEWFMSASESGSPPIVKVSPHQTFGKGH